MDPLGHPAAMVPVVSTVTVGVVVSTAVGVMGGVSSAGVPRGQQHLRVIWQKFKTPSRWHGSGRGIN